MKNPIEPLKLSVDNVTGEPHTYNYGNEYKVAPVNRSNPNYILVGGPNRLEYASLVIAAPEMLATLISAVEEFDEWEGPEEIESDQASIARNQRVRVYENMRSVVAKATGNPLSKSPESQ
jgi:hypothetical protein